MKTFYDTEHGVTITESELYKEFLELQTLSPEYDYTFQSYIRNCTDKNGTLIEISDGKLHTGLFKTEFDTYVTTDELREIHYPKSCAESGVSMREYPFEFYLHDCLAENGGALIRIQQI